MGGEIPQNDHRKRRMIALHLITSGSEKISDLNRCLDSVEGQVDKTFILVTTKASKEFISELEKRAVVEYSPRKFFHTITKKEVKFIKGLGLTPHIKEGDKIFEFDKARNTAMAMVPKDYGWLLWLDADDILRGNKLREIVREAEDTKLDSVFFNYIYQAEIKDGKIKSIAIEHLRERLIRNNGVYEWVAPIHETLIEKRPTRKKDDDRCDVLHLSSRERSLKAVDRNIKALEYLVVFKEGKDPRPIYYLGKAYYDLFLEGKGEHYIDEAKKLFELYLDGEHKSGWAEERSQCFEYLVEIYRSKGQLNNAIKCAHHAMIEDERFPSIYINLALCYIVKKEWSRALWWIKQALKMPQPQTTLVSTPKDLMSRSFEVIYHACLNLSKLDEAFAASVKLCEIYPESKEMKERYEFLSKLKEQRDVTRIFIQLSRYLEQTGQKDKLKPLLLSAPDIIKNNPFISELSLKVNPPKKWNDKSIVIYCGQSFGPWSPRIMNEGGGFVGGSEEAVIYLSRELVKQGWEVTVYADPADDEGTHDGVTYLPYYKFNTKDKFNILVSWRRPDLVDQDLNTKKTYIWCHDIQSQLDYPPERLSKITKIIVLSNWHRQNLPDIPDDKIMLSGNGIEV